jgi:uncharacterized protein (UPF0335 family)
VKNLLLASAVAAALSYVPASEAATSPDDLAQIRQQLQSLVERVDKLEHENTDLKGENEQLKAQADYLRAETKGLRKDAANTAVDVSKVKGTDWASKVAITGDVRYRYEMISDDALNAAGVQATADRYRDRIRARINTTVKATDNITVGFGFTTTENGDPRSGNQTLTNVFSKKELDLDTAYFDWKFTSWGDLIGGKMKQPFFKPGQSVFWDNDITPEGLALNVNSGMFFGTAYSYWLSEVSGPESARTSDTMLYGAQVGLKFPLGAASLTVAAHYYDLRSGQGRSPFYVASPTAAVPVPASAANGNTTVNLVTGAAPNTVTTATLVNDYNVADLSAQFDTMLGKLPFQVWADYAKNSDPDDLNTAWASGVVLGKASNNRTWEVGAYYEKLEKDALFGQLVDSDFGGGVTDVDGWAVKAAYVPVKNWTLNATYFLNKRNMDVPNGVGQTDVDYKRLQVDFNVKF